MIMIGCILHLATLWVVVVGRIVGHCLGEGQAESLARRTAKNGSKDVKPGRTADEIRETGSINGSNVTKACANQN